MLTCILPKRFKGQRFIPVPDETTIITLDEISQQANPFDVGDEALGPITLDIAVNPFEEDETPLTPPHEDSPETPLQEVVSKPVTNPFGSEEQLLMPHKEEKPAVVLNKSVNPFDTISDEDEDDGNPFDRPSNPAETSAVNSKSVNPFDAMSDEDGEGGNPFDVPSKSVNPFDAMSDEDESGGNPFDTPVKKGESVNPFDVVSDNEEDKNPFAVPSTNPFEETVPTDKESKEASQPEHTTPAAIDNSVMATAGVDDATEADEQKRREEIQRQEAILKEQEEKEKQREREEAEKRQREEEALRTKQREALQQQEIGEEKREEWCIDRMMDEERVRVGIQCIKYCSNGKQHKTVVKLLGEKDNAIVLILMTSDL